MLYYIARVIPQDFLENCQIYPMTNEKMQILSKIYQFDGVSVGSSCLHILGMDHMKSNFINLITTRTSHLLESLVIVMQVESQYLHSCIGL